MNPEKRLVSRRSVVKAHKVGEVRAADSAAAHVDAASASRVEETEDTRTYVRPLGLAPPQPLRRALHYDPPPPHPFDPTAMPVPSADNGPIVPRLTPESPRKIDLPPPYDEYIFIGTLLLVILGVGWFAYWAHPREYPLVGVTCRFTGNVGELREVRDEGWSLPANATILTQDERQQSIRSVFSHHETHCYPVTHSRQVYSHTDMECALSIVSWTVPLEIYSHTDELCYDDGTCEEKDVYTKDPSKPIYADKCTPIERFRTETYVTDECKQRAVTRDEPVIRTYWTYLVTRWVVVRQVTLVRSKDEPCVVSDDELSPTERYMTETWDYFIQLVVLSPSIIPEQIHVSKAVYDDYKKRVGEMVTFP